MDSSRKDFLPYAASCNPPRRAKRPSVGNNPLTGTDNPAQPLPALAPAISANSPDPMKAVDDDEFTADVPQPKRRGRKPSSLSRAARESMRRQNHSRIEKARRTKINEALAMLRDLVPADAARKLAVYPDETPDEDDEDEELESGKKSGKGKQRQEKEFKLEILEKAVAYVQELQDKVRLLEAQRCPRCSTVNTPPTHRPKRKREAMRPSDEYDSHSSADVSTERPIKRLTSTQFIPLLTPPTLNTRLPSISSWLPNSVVESVPSESHTPLANPIQLPTPPASAIIGPIASPQVPPALRLELPMASLSARSFAPPTKSTSSSPSWTPEDESIASLLLRIKTSSSPNAGKHGASVNDLLAPTPGPPGTGSNARLMSVDEIRVQTPGSLLGMTTNGPK